VPAERFLPKDGLARAVLLLTLLFMLVVIWIPIADTFVLSMHDAFFLKRTWTGLSNYDRLWNDANFWKSLRVSFTYALMVVPATIVLSMLLAALVNAVRNVALRSALMGFYFFAFIIPLVSVAIFWLFLLQPNEIGLLNALFAQVGLPRQGWLSHSSTALLSLAIVGVWRHIGYAMVLFVAGMQSIPELFHEAAAIDGANAWQRLRHITIPLLMPTTAFVTIIMTLSSLMMFAEVFVMTNPKGGPNRETTTVVYNIYEQAFQNHKEGYASAIAAVFFVIIVAIGYFQFRYLRSRFEY
jgi:multiple sugar transport system permease protein